MTNTDLANKDESNSLVVRAGKDRLDEYRGMGISHIDFKVCDQGPDGLLVIENIFHGKGGPPRHLHHHQDEWFYALEGEFLLEIGSTRFTLRAGDSIMAVRGIPHVWGFVGTGVGRMLISFLPAGRMEAFFREVTQANAMPTQDPEVWKRHGMEVVGPPLRVE